MSADSLTSREAIAWRAKRDEVDRTRAPKPNGSQRPPPPRSEEDSGLADEPAPPIEDRGDDRGEPVVKAKPANGGWRDEVPPPGEIEVDRPRHIDEKTLL